MSFFDNIKKNISKLIGDTKTISSTGVDVVVEGAELWNSITTLNVIGIAKNGCEFLKETYDLLDETVVLFKDTKSTVNDCVNDIGNSQVLKDVNKELGDVKVQWNKLQDTFHTNGVSATIPELVALSTEVSQVVTTAITGITGLASQTDNNAVDNVDAKNVDPAIKEDAQKVNNIIDGGIKIIENGMEEVQLAQKFINEKVNVFKGLAENNALKDFVRSMLSGVDDVDKAKSQAIDSKLQNNDRTIG